MIGYIYVATTPSFMNRGIFKIGCTTKPRRRIRQLNTANYEDFQYILLIIVKDMKKTEERIHNMLESFKVKREFFKLPNYKVIKSMI